MRAGAARYLRDWHTDQVGVRIAGARPATPDSPPMVLHDRVVPLLEPFAVGRFDRTPDPTFVPPDLA